MSSWFVTSVFLILVLVSDNVKELIAQLQVGYYSSTCGMAEYIVKDEVRNAFFKDPGLAAGLVRFHFHDCFVRVSFFKLQPSLSLLMHMYECMTTTKCVGCFRVVMDQCS